ncbi:hypothetical protein QWY87_14405 [Lutimonas halocynthiae]|uniref:hypothetical protein n=1 Tax=Lutimonas halocynthiae TaxID=1446477 RepID=UPI0025B36064|nr:hypothetical protein [Lutimonas halocynthiae]MDN3643906.1 hypothetical protein [Lutimonas halocynthiae]
MKNSLLTYLILLIGLISCEQDAPDQNAVARVNDKYLSNTELDEAMPIGLAIEDSILYRNNYIKIWATKELLLEKARINVEDDNGEIEALILDYRRELLIDRYKKALLQQELDTVITDSDINDYYEANKNVYRLNEDLVQLKYIHFNKDMSDKKELVRLFKSETPEDLEELIDRELEFYSFSFNDSIWVAYRDVEKKLAFLKEEKNIKNKQYIQKEDSLGVYLLAVKDLRRRNEIAPLNYVIPTIKQMILHKRKLELMNEIEKTIMVDAINNKQFEQY